MAHVNMKAHFRELSYVKRFVKE